MPSYIFLAIILGIVLAFGGLKKLSVVVVLILMLFLSMFFHQNRIYGLNVDSSLFSGEIINQENENRYIARVGSGLILIRDEQNLISSHYEWWFLWWWIFKKAIPGGITFFKFSDDIDWYSHRLFMRWFWWVMYLKSFLPMQTSYYERKTTLKGLLDKSKKLISHKIDINYPNPYKWILKAILLGNKEDLDSRQYRQLIDTGLVHIVVISGAHLGLIAWALGALLMWTPFYLRLILIFLLSSFYMLLVGVDPSILRAWLLMSLYLFFVAVGREVLIWRVLWMVWIIMLIYNPRFLTYDIGFLLSFAAVGGIVLFLSLINEFVKNRHFQKLVGIIFVPIGAFLGILPVLLFFVWEVNLLSWALNILILPLLPIIMIGGIFSLLVPWIAFVVERMIDILLIINRWGLEYGVWLQAPKYGRRVMWLLFLSILWLYSAYLLFWKFLPYYRYEKLYNGTQRHKSVTDQIKL